MISLKLIYFPPFVYIVTKNGKIAASDSSFFFFFTKY